MRINLGCLLVALLLSTAILSSEAKENTLQEREKPGIDKIARLTAREHSTILFTLANELMGYAKDGHVTWIDPGHSPSYIECQYPHPALSHDGLRVAFVSDGDPGRKCSIVIYDIPTGERKTLVGTEDDPGEIAWSWDDKEIAFLEHGISTVSVADRSREAFPLPWADKECHEMRVSVWQTYEWFRNGRGFILEFIADIPTKQPGTYTSRSEIFIVRDDNAHLLDIGHQPAVSPDSDRVAYYAREGILEINPDGSGRKVLWRASKPWPLLSACCPNVFPPFSALLDKPIVWSHDGSQLFYGTWESEDYRDSIYLLDVKSG